MKTSQANNWSTEQVNLEISLTTAFALITNSFVCKKINKDAVSLKLWGKSIDLVEIYVDNKKLKKKDYLIDKTQLTIKEVKDASNIQIKTKIFFASTKKTGLFLADKKIFSPNFKNNFNYITYFFDNPYLCVHFLCKITASKEKFPHLLADGVLVDKGSKKQEHWVLWKSCSARSMQEFSIVAGKFFVIKEQINFEKKSVEITLYAPDNFQEYCNYAVDCIKKIMQFDYDLLKLIFHTNSYKIVGLKNYKENIIQGKELNIFDIQTLIATPKIATPLDYIHVDRNLAKRYFWSSLKTKITQQGWFHHAFYQAFGLFRFHDYLTHQYGETFQTIHSVKEYKKFEATSEKQTLSPKEFFSDTNNYSQDYPKIEKIFRMLSLGVGKSPYLTMLNKYFEQCKKTETTLESFFVFLQNISKKKLKNFDLWFTEKEAPQIKILEYYNSPSRTYRLFFFQIDKKKVIPQHQKYWKEFLDSYDEKVKSKFLVEKKVEKKLDISSSLAKLPLTENPFQIYLTTHWRNNEGASFFGSKQNRKQKVIEIRKNYHKDFVCYDTANDIIPFFNYGLVTPASIDYTYNYYQQVHINLDEQNQYICWYSYNFFLFKKIEEQLMRYLDDKVAYIDDDLTIYLQKIITKLSFHNSFIYHTIQIPTEEELFFQAPQKNTEAIHYIRQYLQKFLAKKLLTEFINLYQRSISELPFNLEKKEFFQRMVKNLSLTFITHADEKSFAINQFKNSKSLEDTISSMQAFNDIDCEERAQIFEETEKKWKNNRLLLAKWIYLQVTSKHSNAINAIEKLAEHPLVKTKHLSTVFYTNFVNHNFYCFHHVSGRGYELVKKFILEIDKINPEISCKLVVAFQKQVGFSKIKEQRKQKHLEDILSEKISRELKKMTKNLIPDV